MNKITISHHIIALNKSLHFQNAYANYNKHGDFLTFNVFALTAKAKKSGTGGHSPWAAAGGAFNFDIARQRTTQTDSWAPNTSRNQDFS